MKERKRVAEPSGSLQGPLLTGGEGGASSEPGSSQSSLGGAVMVVKDNSDSCDNNNIENLTQMRHGPKSRTNVHLFHLTAIR